MIIRIWHGATTRQSAAEYAQFLKNRAIPDYRATPGNVGAWVLTRDASRRCHFVTVSAWQDEEAIRNFAGPYIDVAKYYDEDRDYLIEFEPTVTHYHVSSGEVDVEACLDGESCITS